MKKQVLKSYSDVAHWFDVIANTDKLACDTETTSLDYSILKLDGMGFCDGKCACYIDHGAFSKVGWKDTLKYLKMMFKDKIHRLIFHNAPFDLMVLWKIGIRNVTKDIFCTMTAAHLLDECGLKGLKDLAMTKLGVPFDEIKKYDVASKCGTNTEEFYSYAMNDPIWTWGLHEIFYKELHQERLQHLFFKEEMPFQFCLMDLAVNGILVDKEAVEDIEDSVVGIEQDSEVELLRLTGRDYSVQKAFWEDLDVVKSPIKFSSNTQVIPIIVDELGIKLTDRTSPSKMYPKGQLKLDKEVLEKFSAHPFIYELRKFRTAKHIHSNFTVPILKATGKDGRVRANFNNCIARTGRLTSSEPNLQNLRRLNKDLGIDCRGCFISSKGKTFIVADYAGQELRVLAQETQDAKLLEAFREYLDLHLVTGNLLFDLGLSNKEMCTRHKGYDDIKKKYKDERHKGKNGFNFPVVYGSTAVGIARNIGVTEKEAQRLLDKFLSVYPGIKQGIDRCIRELEVQGWVRNMAGRKRRWEHISKAVIRQAFNFKIQGYSADMLKLAATKVREVGLKNKKWGLQFVLTVHDELVYEVKDAFLVPAMKAIEKCMVTAVKLDIPLEAKVSSGKVYSEAK